jgi:hypothetical protein
VGLRCFELRTHRGAPLLTLSGSSDGCKSCFACVSLLEKTDKSYLYLLILEKTHSAHEGAGSTRWQRGKRTEPIVRRKSGGGGGGGGGDGDLVVWQFGLIFLREFKRHTKPITSTTRLAKSQTTGRPTRRPGYAVRAPRQPVASPKDLERAQHLRLLEHVMPAPSDRLERPPSCADF